MTCRWLVVCCLVLSASATRAWAQESVPRVEVGADLSFFQVRYWPTDTGAGGHVTIALTPHLAIETRVRRFPGETFPALERGGKTLQFFAGARATFASRGPFTLYGLLLPGVIHFSNSITEVTRTSDHSGPLTHFALDMGMGAAVRLPRRWSAHAEWTGPLYGVRGFSELSSFPPAAERGIQVVTAGPSVQGTLQVSVGLSYRLGSLPAARRRRHPAGGWWAVTSVGDVRSVRPVTGS